MPILTTLTTAAIAAALTTSLTGATGQPEFFQTHGYQPHLHTSSPAKWQTIAEVDLDVVPDSLLLIHAETNIRYHHADILSHTARILVNHDYVASRGGISWTEAKKYIRSSYPAMWRVPAHIDGVVRVQLQIRLLSIPRDGEQGHKVFFNPGHQRLSVHMLDILTAPTTSSHPSVPSRLDILTAPGIPNQPSVPSRLDILTAPGTPDHPSVPSRLDILTAP